MTLLKSRVADLARQAKAAGLTAQVGLFSDQYRWIAHLTKVPFLCTPGSEQIRATIERDNITQVLTVNIIPRMERLTSLNLILGCWRSGIGKRVWSLYRPGEHDRLLY